MILSPHFPVQTDKSWRLLVAGPWAPANRQKLRATEKEIDC